MKIEKKVLANLNKCYSIAPLFYEGQDCFLVAAEKHDPCYLFDAEGQLIDKVWDEPGGVMSMVQIPGSNGQFLAVHQFYSPNDSKEAKIVAVTPQGKGSWQVKKLVDLPFVHRFDLLARNGKLYLIACTLKSGHEHKDDWSMPGKVYAAVLPDDLSKLGDVKLELTVLKDGMLKNHGYYRVRDNDIQTAVVSCNEGVYQFIPPSADNGEWEIRQLLASPASDAVLIDLDGDGEKELVVIAPFHGNNLSIYKKNGTDYQKVFEYEDNVEFLHAIYAGAVCKTPAVFIGCRKAGRDLFVFTYDSGKKKYVSEVIDHDCGSANVFYCLKNGKDTLISANREIDEIALYTIEK